MTIEQLEAGFNTQKLIFFCEEQIKQLERIVAAGVNDIYISGFKPVEPIDGSYEKCEFRSAPTSSNQFEAGKKVNGSKAVSEAIPSIPKIMLAAYKKELKRLKRELESI